MDCISTTGVLPITTNNNSVTAVLATTTDDATTATTTDDATTDPININLDMCLELRARILSQTVARDISGILYLYPAQLNVLTRLVMMKFKSLHHKSTLVLFVYLKGGGSLSDGWWKVSCA